ncbi:MAG: type I DNA topoisomerase [Minisyncoccia bacterium]
MKKTLVIVESPAKARTIQHYLGKEYEVVASVGHVRDLPKSSKDAIDIEGGFTPRYVISPGKKDVIERIHKAAEKASTVLLATDPDREGEAIAWHLQEAMELKKPKRVVFHEITKDAIIEAIAHPRSIDTDLRQAQEARRVLDRLVGYDLSGLIWKKVRYGLSAGRVQSPALRILVEREREIKAFVPKTYYVLSALFDSKSGSFPALCVTEPTDDKEAARIVTLGKEASWKVGSVGEKAEERSPRPPFTTSTLQQVASTRLGFAPSRTMRAAQKLYEAGHITYMRTDSVTLGKEAIARLAHVAEKEFGKEYVQVRAYKTKSKNAQEAHEAVRPTSPEKIRAGATGDEQSLYELIRIRALASQMANAKVIRTKIEATADRDIPLFVANGSRVVFPGWLSLDTRARGEDVELPSVRQDDPLSLQSLESEEKATQPPNRYTEAGLIKELEKRGIGRPSTYASIMKTIQDRGYVEKEGRALRPTATGMVVSGWLEEHFASYISDTFTAEMENELDEIARGEREYVKTMRDFYTPFQKAVEAKADLPKATALGAVPQEFSCPKCESPMEYKLGRGGIFMSCTRYPECDGARQEDGHELRADEPLGIHQETKLPIYIRTGRFGPYVEMPEDKVGSEEKIVGSEEKEKGKKKQKRAKKPAFKGRRASLPAGKNPKDVTLEDAVKYLSLPRELGTHPKTGLPVMANTGRFGPYVAHDGEFRSIRKGDPYTITLSEAMVLIDTPKAPPKGATIAKELGKHPTTGKALTLYKSKQGLFLKKGIRRIYLPDSLSIESFTPKEAAEYLA